MRAFYSAYTEFHIKKVASAYTSILKYSVSPANNVYDGAILLKSITCFEHIFKASYIEKYQDNIDFDTISGKQILAKINSIINKKWIYSLNYALGTVLLENGHLPKEFFEVFKSINPERNDETHGKADPSQQAIVVALTQMKSIVNWFFCQFEIYNWEADYVDPQLIEYENSFMERLSTFLKQTNDTGKLKLNKIERINNKYFNEEILDKETCSKLSVDFYTKFNNNQSNLKRIIANQIYIEPPSKFTVSSSGLNEAEELKTEKLVSKAAFGHPLLIKIMAEGGFGKSTLLWHFIKFFSDAHYKVFYISEIDIEEIERIFDSHISHDEEGHILFFIDELVTSEVNRENLVQFGKTIAKYSTKAPIILFCTERIFRYNNFRNKRKFEENFSTISNINYSTRDIRNSIFEKVFESLFPCEIKDPERVKEDCFRLFHQVEGSSLIDSIFNVLIYLKKNRSDINYEFDWEDWRNHNQIKELENLFEIVAFFYRYGIQVPLKFRNKDFFNLPKTSSLLINSLEDSQSKTVPVLISTDSDSNFFLRLRHEKIAEWYFTYIGNQDLRQKLIFDSFIEDISDEFSAYLFRNLTESAEFNRTPLSKRLDSEKKIEIIKKYLAIEVSTSDSYGKGAFYLSSIFLKDGNNEAAQNILLHLISVQPKNVYAYHGLGELYYADGNLILAEENFKKSYELEPGSMYSIGSMYKLYDISNNILELHKLKLKLLDLSRQDVKYAFNFLMMVDSVENIYNYELDQLEELWSDHMPYRSKLSQVYYRKGNFTKASSVLTRILRFVNPHDFLSRLQLATLYLRQAELPRYTRSKNNLLAGAEAHLKESILINPENVHSYTELARVYVSKGDLEAALLELEKAFKVSPKNIPPRNIYIDIILLQFKKTPTYNLGERVGLLEKAQLYLLATLKLKKSNPQTIILLEKVNYTLINVLVKEGYAIEALFEANLKARNKNAERLTKVHFYFMNRLLQKDKGYLINKLNQACAGLLGRHLFEQNKIEEAEKILKIVLFKFPGNYEAAICLIKIYHGRNEKGKIFEFLVELRNAHLSARHFLMLIKEMGKSSFYDYIDYFLNYKHTVWEAYEVIEFSVFLYSIGKFEKSYNVLNIYKKHPSFDTLLIIYQQRTSEIKDFELIDLVRFAKKDDATLKQSLDSLSYTISILYIFSKNNSLREVGIKILKILNFKSKSLIGEPHFESLKRIAQAYLKTYDKSFKILKSALEYYQKAYLLNGSDVELNKELINTYIELGQYKSQYFQTAIFTSKELQKKFPIEPIYLYLEAKALKKVNRPDEIYGSIQKFSEAEILVDRNLKIENSFRVPDLKKISDCFRKKAAYNYQIAECSKALLATKYNSQVHVESMILKRSINSLNFYYLSLDNIVYKDLNYSERNNVIKLKARLVETEEQVADDLIHFYLNNSISKTWLLTALKIYNSVLMRQRITGTGLNKKIEELKKLI